MLQTYHGQTPVAMPAFRLGDEVLEHFVHNHNVNHPPFRMTERSIELAVANRFLERYSRDEVLEIGAVTPYYWPHRVPRIVDPFDRHALVTDRVDWLKTDITAGALLSISTFEHIGLPDYGQPADAAMSRAALEKLIGGAWDFLVTLPGGYNPALDALVRELHTRDGGFDVFAWQRGAIGNDWTWCDFGRVDTAALRYGPFWANTLLMLHRGSWLKVSRA